MKASLFDVTLQKSQMKLTTLFIACFFCCTICAQVTVGSGIEPMKGALLDMKENQAKADNTTATKGLELPRVALQKRNELYPMFEADGSEYKIGGVQYPKADEDNRHIGLVVYNLTPGVCNTPTEGLCPGVYVWDGALWVRIPRPCEPCTPPALPLEWSPNSYIVSNGSVQDIPLGKPYLVSNGYSSTDAGINQPARSDVPAVQLTDKAFVELLWQDTPGLISSVALDGANNGPASVMKVTAAPGKTGNAVVAVRMGPAGAATDPVVWSWHIWVTDYNPDISGSITYNNGGPGNSSTDFREYTIMDRNLGATKNTASSASDIGARGLQYQWGRKDPFPGTQTISGTGHRTAIDLYRQDGTVLVEGTNGIMPVPVPADPSNLKNSIENPMNFYYLNEVNPPAGADWYTAVSGGGDDELWAASGRKSAFDPCPKGWRVPAYSKYDNTNYANCYGPWYTYEVFDGFMGPETDCIGFSQYGLNLPEGNDCPGKPAQGFIPFGISRGPSHVSGTCVDCNQNVGSGGGVFDLPGGNQGLGGTVGSLWTANANTLNGAGTRKAEYTGFQSPYGFYSSTMDPDYIQSPASKASDVAVRCVKVDNTGVTQPKD